MERIAKRDSLIIGDNISYVRKGSYFLCGNNLTDKEISYTFSNTPYARHICDS